MHINWFALTIIAIWFFCTIAAIFTKDSGCIAIAFLTTLFMCLGYFLFKL